MASYITIAEADAFAVGILAPDSWLANGTFAKTAGLERATREIDSLRFQGSRYDASQPLAFPRTADGAASLAQTPPIGTIWDWDEATQTAVVPAAVKRACFEQALFILSGSSDQRRGRLEAQADGVVAQSAGGVSESYRADGRASAVCLEATQLLKPYLLRTGRLV